MRAGLSMWARLPSRNAALLELTASFLFSAAGIVSLFLPPLPREALLRELGLWDAFCEGMGVAAFEAVPLSSSRPDAGVPAGARAVLRA